MTMLRKITKRILVISNLVVVLLFLLACINPLLHPAKWWVVSLLGLIFPLLLLLVSIFLVFWMVTRRRWVFLSLGALILGWPNISAFFAFHPGAGFKPQKQSGSLRVLSWNVRSWDELTGLKKNNLQHRTKMMEFIREQDADVLCFQEFFESTHQNDFPENISYIREQLHFPYYLFSRDYHRYDWAHESGVIIFSKYPITDSLKIKFPKKDNIRGTESLIAVDIEFHGHPVRVFTTHLQSVLFHNRDFHNIEIIKNGEDSLLQASKSIVKKLRNAFGLRGEQADLVREQLDRSPYPVIICGDFNDVPNSYTYFKIRSHLQDAFIKKGFGIGRTYMNLSPTLRIDYIMADPAFTVQQCKRFNLPYSDHHPVMADFLLPDPGN